MNIGPDPHTPAASQPAARAAFPRQLRVWPGPRTDWFSSAAWNSLLSGRFEVTSTSRVGLRLGGVPLIRHNVHQLPSEGLIEGAMQVPPDGLPIIMLADHPTTGGYPVIAVIDPSDLHHAAQAAPGGMPLHFMLAR